MTQQNSLKNDSSFHIDMQHIDMQHIDVQHIDMQLKERAVTQADVAAYSASMLAGLSQVAKGVELSMLAYLLDMARLEAENILK